MINKKLQDYILTHASSLRPIDQIGRNIFYIPPTDHILAGFFIDKGKNYTYFGQIITPICDKLNVIGPGLGGRFEGECSGVEGGISDNDIGTSFIECVERYIESVQNLKQTTNFLNRFYEHDILKNFIYRRIYANCLIISGHHEAAKEHIIKVINDVNLKNTISEFDKNFLTETKLILYYINISVIKAQSLLLKWEENNKRMFIIE